MARGINKVILVGNIGNDPDIRYMPNGSAVANVSLATSEAWKDKQTGESKERTEWHRLTFYSRLAEIVGEYVKKGSKIYAEGALRTRKWQDKNGQDRYTTEIVVNEMQMLDSRNIGDMDSRPMQSSNATESDLMPPPPAGNSGPADNFDDDIPF